MPVKVVLLISSMIRKDKFHYFVLIHHSYHQQIPLRMKIFGQFFFKLKVWIKLLNVSLVGPVRIQLS